MPLKILTVLICCLVAGCSPVTQSDQAEIDRAERYLHAIVDGDEPLIHQETERQLAVLTMDQMSMILGWFGTEVPEFEYLFSIDTEQDLPAYGRVDARTLLFEAPVDKLSMVAADPDHPLRANWVYGEVTFAEIDGERKVVGWFLNPSVERISQANTFGFTGVSVLHYIVFALAIAMPVICIAAVILMLIGPSFRLRWLWALGSLIGIGQIKFNWTTADLIVNPFFIQLLGAGYVRMGPFAPVIIHISVPIFALAYLFHKRRAVFEEQTAIADTFDR